MGATATEQRAPARPAASNALVGLIAEFRTPGELVGACRRVREQGYTRFDAHTPFPVHGIDPAIGITPTKLPIFVFVCGLIGCLTGVFLQWWSNATDATQLQGLFDFVPRWFQSFLGYNYVVSGKPFFSLPANIPVIFELTILFSALGAGVGMLVFNNLPLWNQPLFNSQRLRGATTGSFLLAIDAQDAKFEVGRTEELLRSLGSAGVERVIDRDDTPTAIPGAIHYIGFLCAILALIPLVVVAMARNNKSLSPPIHLIQDMDNQEKYKAQQALPLFADGRAMRPPVEGAVARGPQFLLTDEHFYRGYVNNTFVTSFPVVVPATGQPLAINEAFLRRGQERFNIYCSACHGRDGLGAGAVNNRALELGGGWVQAGNLHDAEIRGRPHGHLFNTITNGIRTMPSYGERIPELDRWAIVAYVRALQRSMNASEADVPADKLAELKSR